MTDSLMSNVEFVEEVEAEEVGSVSPLQISQVVLSATDWTTETILSQFNRGNIDIKPRFQRRDAWTVRKKSQFIESLILGLPIPQIVLAEKKGERGRYIVLDGKQRLLTLLQFTGRFEGKHDNFKLAGLEVREDLNGFRFDDLQNASMYQDDINSFYNQTIRTVVIRNWPNTSFLHVVFLRLNTGSVPLSPQELRQALFPGEFVNYIDDRASESEILRKLLGNKEPDFRMRDIEILVRYLAFTYFISDYSGNMSFFLDYTCSKLNELWSAEQEGIKASIDDFEQAMITVKTIFGDDNIGKKWTSNGFERRLNRAVLDSLLFYFSNKDIRESALAHSKDVLDAFKQLCETSPTFRSSIEVTTKSMRATYDRLFLWGQSLESVLPIAFGLPSFNNERKHIDFNGF